MKRLAYRAAFVLAVLAALAVLGAMVWFRHPRGGQQVQCSQNLYALSPFLMDYLEEHDGTLPASMAEFREYCRDLAEVEHCFTCPMDEPGALSYEFVASGKAPQYGNDRCVLIRELCARHGGRATVMWAGHAIGPEIRETSE